MSDGGNSGDWIGRTHTVHDIASASAIAGFDALLDRPPKHAAFVPPLGHWLYFPPVIRQSELGADGHPKLGVLLPDLGLPRRMWVGGSVRFHRPIAIGTPITRRTTIRSIDMKHGSSGPLGFLTLSHEISAQDTLLVSEEQNLVYREASRPAGPAPRKPALPEERSTGEMLTRKRFSPVELFRFSALTGNTHRIHYDADYARNVEGYPGLVVHGPFQAMVLMDLFLRHTPRASVTGFDFRATAPLFADEEASVYRDERNLVTLRICPAGRPSSMTATIYTASASQGRPDRTSAGRATDRHLRDP